jgi:hypothetical protein
MGGSLVFECGTGDSDLDGGLREVLVVFFQPFEVRVVVLDAGRLPHERSDGLQALIGKVGAHEVGQILLAAAVEGEGQLLDDLAHVGEGAVVLAGHQVVVQLLEDQGEAVGSLCALSLVGGFHEVLFGQEGAFLLHLRLVDGLEHGRVCIAEWLHIMICFSFFCWSSAYSLMIFTKIFASLASSLVQTAG